MYRRYRFRAECFADFDMLRDMLNVRKVRSYKIYFEPLAGMWVPDVEITLVTNYRLEQLLGLMSQIEDGHVMYESLDFEKFYTGNRFRKLADAVNRRTKISK